MFDYIGELYLELKLLGRWDLLANIATRLEYLMLRVEKWGCPLGHQTDQLKE